MDEYRSLLTAIEEEYIQLRYRWAIFDQLFDSGQDKIDILNKSGSNVFQLLQKLIIDDVMIRLSRLSDPPKSMGHENASLNNLVQKLDQKLSSETKVKISEKLTELGKHLDKVKTLRNKSLSHTDLAHAINPEMLPRPTYEEIEGAMSVVSSVLNDVTGCIFDYTSEYDPSLPYGHDGNKLLALLFKAHSDK